MFEQIYDQELLIPLPKLPIRIFNFQTKDERLSYPMHWHKDIEMLYCMKGQLEVLINQQLYILTQGEIIFINPNEIHTTHGSKDNDILVFQMNGDFFSRLTDNLHFKIDRDLLLKKSKENDFGMMLLEIFSQVTNKEEGYLLKVYSLVYEMFYRLIKEYKLSGADIKILKQKKMNLLNEICLYIQKHYQEQLTLSQISIEFSYTPQYLSSLFSHHLNVTLEYLNSVRVENSIHFLIDTDEQLSEIALQCGFSSPRAFNREFKKIYQIYPNEFRKQSYLKK